MNLSYSSLDIAQDPTSLRTSPEALFKLGSAFYQQGKVDEALQHLERCVELKPDLAEAYLTLNKIYQQQNRPDFAAASLMLYLDYVPNSIAVLFDLGNLFAAYKDYGNATIYFQRILEIDPDNGSARHAVAALTGETTLSAPRQHVQNLFDGMADSFESHLTELRYFAPEKLKEMLFSLSRGKPHFHRAIDFGCGTGLSGIQFRPLVTHFTGVDLSPKMINIARERKIYDELAIEDVCQFIESSNQQYDLFIATDVFIYVGDIAHLFQMVSAHSLPGAHFLFTTEVASEEKNYVLRPTGRYAHSRHYIEMLANTHGFDIQASVLEDLRNEGLQPIKGELFVLRVKK
ncbi:MAG: methyltransferase domain-containing protein [Gallionella sp.]